MFLPIIYSIVVVLLYFILNLVKLMNFSSTFIPTMIIFIAMFFQPDCLKFLLSSTGCKRLGSGFYLIADANYECYTNVSYKSFMSYFTVPALAFWALLPFGILALLASHRH